jgi:glutathione S-transferase
MINVYSWPTPNGHKVHIMLEECGLSLGRDWQAIPVNIGTGEQFKPEFLAISPNNKIPALVDPVGPDGKPISLFESGAILLYLAAKTGKLPARKPTRAQVRGAAVADVPDGRRRARCSGRPTISAVRARKDRLRHQPLHQRGQAAVRRDDKRLAAASSRRATNTASPTSPSSPGCATGRTRASTGPTTRT